MANAEFNFQQFSFISEMNILHFFFFRLPSILYTQIKFSIKNSSIFTSLSKIETI